MRAALDWRRIRGSERVYVTWYGRWDDWSQGQCPTLQSLCEGITYDGPRPAEVERVVRTVSRQGSIVYILICQRKCPVLLTSGATCPICRREH